MMTKDKKNFGIIRNVLNLHPLCLLKYDLINCESSSGVEHHLAKVGVAGSNPVFRSEFLSLNAEVVELVDTLDLKSNGH